jgi:hypothetical protein
VRHVDHGRVALHALERRPPPPAPLTETSAPYDRAGAIPA